MKKITAAFVSGAFLCVAASAIAAEDFPTGNMEDAVNAMDSDDDNLVSEEEFMTFEETNYDKNAAQVPSGNMAAAVAAPPAASKQEFLAGQKAAFGRMTKTSDGQVPAKDMQGYIKGPTSQ